MWMTPKYSCFATHATSYTQTSLVINSPSLLLAFRVPLLKLYSRVLRLRPISQTFETSMKNSPERSQEVSVFRSDDFNSLFGAGSSFVSEKLPKAVPSLYACKVSIYPLFSGRREVMGSLSAFPAVQSFCLVIATLAYS